ncbi:MAG: YaiI/YqxD family protein [Ruminococcus sp.]|nr:YaiI/YqxD family protein [Ruminococcus sp.]
MKVLIDADGCPVVSITIKLCKKYNILVTIVCDTSHEFYDDYAKVITVSKGADSSDFKIVSLAFENDIVITQDYGLAAMCLAKKCKVLSQDGMFYDNSNIDSLLLSRHTAKKIRNAGGRLKGNPKRTKQQDIDFENALLQLLA